MVVKLARRSDNPVGRCHASTGFYQVGISDSEQITRQPEWQGRVKLTRNALITDVQPNQRFSGHSNGHSVRHPRSAEGPTAIAGSLHPC